MSIFECVFQLVVTACRSGFSARLYSPSGPLSSRCRRPRLQGHGTIGGIINNKRDCCGLKTSDKDPAPDRAPFLALALSSLFTSSSPVFLFSSLLVHQLVSLCACLPLPSVGPGCSRGRPVAGARAMGLRSGPLCSHWRARPAAWRQRIAAALSPSARVCRGLAACPGCNGT